MYFSVSNDELLCGLLKQTEELNQQLDEIIANHNGFQITSKVHLNSVIHPFCGGVL